MNNIIHFTPTISRFTWYSISLMLFIGLSLSVAAFLQNKENIKRIIPNIWTALGLLGTFVSLALSFLELDISNTKQIEELPHKLATAFITSILGILGAQFTSYIISKKHDKEKGTKAYLQEDPEKMLMELRDTSLRNELQIGMLNQTMQQSNKDLAQIRKSFETISSTFASQFSLTMERLNESIKSDVVHMNENLVSHTKEIQNNFKSLVEESTKEFEKNNLESAQQLQSNMSTVTNLIKEDVQKLQDNLSKSVSTFINQQKVIHDSALKRQEDHLNKSFNELAQINKNSQEAAEDFKNLIQETKMQAIDETNRITSTLHNEFKKLVDTIKLHSDTSEKTINASTARLKESVDLYDKQKNHQQDILNKLDDQLKRIDDLVEARNAELGKYQFYEERANAHHEGIDVMLSTIVKLREWLDSKKN